MFYNKVFGNRVYSQLKKMSLKGVKFSWDLKINPQELSDKTNELILKTRNDFNNLEKLPVDGITSENFLKVVADIERDFSTGRYYFDFIRYVSTDENLRNASSESDKKLTEFAFENKVRSVLFQQLQALQEKEQNLPYEASQYLKKLIKIRKQIGLHLPEETRKEVKVLKDQINDLRAQFNRNLSNDKTFVEFTEEELKGLDDEFISNLIKNADTNKLKVTMKYPDYLPVMRKAKNPETRRKLCFAYNSRLKENIPIIEELGVVRHELANLLGFNTYSDYKADNFMVKSAAGIDDFLMNLAKKLFPLWEEEKKYLLELKETECKNENVPFDGKLNPWDMHLYLTKVEEIKYAVNDDIVKEYFPLPFVTKAIFSIYQKILGLTFQKIEGVEVWHPDVDVYGITDNETKTLLGYVFMDLFPREGKYSHYRIQRMQEGCLDSDGTRQLAVVALLANFPKPTAEKPALLPHKDVTTYFHEFGHVMHYICNQANYSLFSGTAVEIDFLEAPSQMLENWCWVPEILRMISSHYIDGKPLTDELISALIKSKLANVGYLNLRQICLSLIDQKLHTTEKLDTAKTYKDIVQEIVGLEVMDGTNFCSTFQHIADKYAASYFCYLWSEVFSIDMFETCFGKEGVMDPNLGKLYREKILKPGGTEDAIDLLKNYLGREPSPDAFLRSKGLLA